MVTSASIPTRNTERIKAIEAELGPIKAGQAAAKGISITTDPTAAAQYAGEKYVLPEAQRQGARAGLATQGFFDGLAQGGFRGLNGAQPNK